MIRCLFSVGLALAALGCGGSTEQESETRYLAFSADSDTLGRLDLHVVNAADPALDIRVLASSVGVASWSPDGRWLAFSSEGVFVADAEHDFALEQLAENPSQVRWSATSRWIAFYVTSPSPALVLRDVLGVEPDRIEAVDAPSYHAGIGWSPQGERYLFPRSEEPQPEEWFVVTPDEPARPLGISGTGLTGRTFRFSPDGQRIAMFLFGDDGRELLYSVDVHEEPMVPRLLLDPGPGSFVSSYAWSGDSSLLVAASNVTLWSVPVESGASAEAFVQASHWQLGDGGRMLAYIADQQLWVHTLAGGELSAATSIETSAVRALHASETSDSLLYQLMAEPGRLYHVRASGGPATPLHEPESQYAEHWEPPLSPDGRLALLDLDLGDTGRELRAVELRPGTKSKLSIPVAENNPFDVVEWGDSSRFSFAYDVRGWISLYIASVEDGSVSRVYAPKSNLRTIQWTGWQP